MSGRTLWLPDGAARADLATFARRARRIDSGGAVRLTAHGNVLTVTAPALHGAGGPTVLAMRALVLAEASDVDATVPLSDLVDRLARRSPLDGDGDGDGDGSGDGGGSGRVPVPVAVPPQTRVGATWAGVPPPRRGWVREGAISVPALAGAAREGIAAVAAGTPPGAGAAAVARLRAGVWGRPLAGHPGVPTGVAFAADAFGFLAETGDGPGVDEPPAALFRAGRWIRLSTDRGHVLARPAASLLG